MCDCVRCRIAGVAAADSGKRRRAIAARLTEREFAALMRIADLFDCSQSDALRFAILAADARPCTQTRAPEEPSDQLAYLAAVCGEEY